MATRIYARHANDTEGTTDPNDNATWRNANVSAEVTAPEAVEDAPQTEEDTVSAAQEVEADEAVDDRKD